MNTTPSPNPFSGLKATLARILSGGWMGLVLHLLFRRRIEAALTALEGLFAQWKAGTLAPLAVALPVPAVPAMRTGTRARAAGGQVAAAPRGRRPVAAACAVAVSPVTAQRVVVTAWCWPAVADSFASPLYALRPSRRRGRCTKRLVGGGGEVRLYCSVFRTIKAVRRARP
jgi:hypothetical protein